MNTRKRKKQLERRLEIGIRICFTVVIILMLVISLPHLFTKKYKYRDSGIKCYKSADYERAVSYFDDALLCRQWFSKEADIDILMYKADCHIRLNEFADAYEAYNKILSDYNDKYFDYDDVKFLANLALCLESYSNGNYGSNAAVFAKAVEKGYTEMSLYAANCYEQSEDYENMIKYYDIYTASYGTTGLIAYKYANYYMSIGDYNKALTYIEGGLACQDEYADDLLYSQILCYRELGDYEKALGLSESYVALYPDDQKGKDMYDFLYTRVNADTNVVHPIY